MPMPDLYRAADIVLSVPSSDGLPVSVLEVHGMRHTGHRQRPARAVRTEPRTALTCCPCRYGMSRP